MLTRLRVENFKSLASLDIHFGPFTCVAGGNGVGKSNLFDAILFLSALANHPLMEAAQRVRGVELRGDVRTLFYRSGDQAADEMRLSAEMIIPQTGTDELGQSAEASMTWLEYEIRLGWVVQPTGLGAKLVLRHESLTFINKSSVRKKIHFSHSKAWIDSIILGTRKSPYISTEITENGAPVIQLHADGRHGKGGGLPRRIPAHNLPRTVLSSVNNAEEHRTAVLARQEMAAWLQLQLEPSALRRSDDFTSPASLAANGAHLPATLYALALQREATAPGSSEDLYADIAARLSRLIESVRDIRIDKDEKRQLLTLTLQDQNKTEYAASSLSDGTLRFLALAALEHTSNQRLIYLEEPENGIHPLRIKPIIDLLKLLSTDTGGPIDETNPLRQIIINTHSPLVISELLDDEIIFLHQESVMKDRKVKSNVIAYCINDTWRSRSLLQDVISKGDIENYLSPTRPNKVEARDVEARDGDSGARTARAGHPPPSPIKDRPDLQILLPFRRAGALTS